MIDTALLDQFCEKLAFIIHEEAQKGNPVVETEQGWPELRTIMVFLGKPFVGVYDHPGLIYREVNDPHYWKAEYFDEASGHVLACKYGDSI